LKRNAFEMGVTVPIEIKPDGKIIQFAILYWHTKAIFDVY
jgi:hypothetical protein